jgi:hypothetical protein
VPPRASFLFKHALVRDIAYSTLLLGLRRSLHGQIAHALEERFRDTMRGGPKHWLTILPKRVSWEVDWIIDSAILLGRSVAGIDDRPTWYRLCTTSCTAVAKAGE